MGNFIYGMAAMSFIAMVTGVSPEKAIENLREWGRLFGISFPGNGRE